MQQLIALNHDNFEWQDKPIPTLRSGHDALVRPLAVSICDADRAYIRGQLPVRKPFCFGHEFIADVLAVSQEVHSIKVGDRVAVSFLIACGTCQQCKLGYPAACTTVPPNSAYGFGIFGDWGGALSDVVRVPFAEAMLTPLPHGVSPVHAASAGDNLADAFRCVAEGLVESPGSPSLIVAGSGGCASIGLYAAALAVALGSSQVDYMDDDPTRLSLAEEMGAHPIQMAHAPTRYQSYWVTADTSGDPSGRWLSTALNSTAPYGRCTSCGIYHKPASLPLGEMYMRGVRFTIGWANVPVLMPKLLKLLAQQRIPLEKMHTIANWEQATEALKDPPLKLILARSELFDKPDATGDKNGEATSTT